MTPARLAGQGYRPETPGLFAGVDIERGNETSDTIITTGGANENLIFDDKRSACCAIVSIAQSIGDIPYQISRASIETEKVCIVCLHIDTRSENGDPTVDVSGCIVNEALCNRTSVMPKSLPCDSIESIGIVGAGDEHHTGNDNRSDLQNTGVAAMKHPLGTKLAHILRCYLGQATISSSRVVTVIGSPVIVQGSIY